MENQGFNTQKQQKKGRLFLFLLVGVLFVVGIGVLTWWQIFGQQMPHASGINNNTHFSTSTPVSKNTPPEVASDVRQHVAQQLHLSVDQLTAKLQSGVSIKSLAMQQGMSSAQWHTFVIDTYQAAYNRDVSAGKLEQARADNDMRHLRSNPPDALGGWVTMECLGT